MPGSALVDGQLSKADWLDQRACQFGDGLFETIAVVDGRPCLWEAHMARLGEGCRRLRLPAPDFATLAAECNALGAGHARAALKVIWTAGRSTRGYRRPHDITGQRILRITPWPEAGHARPWRLRLCRQRLSENPVLAQIKHLNRLDQVIARAEWDGPEIDEGLMLGQDGRVVCGTRCNLFLQSGGSLRTASIESAGIAGVVRALLLEVADRAGQRVEQRPITLDEVQAADGLYLTNSLVGVVRVAQFESTTYDLGLPEPAAIAEARRRCHQGSAAGDPA